MVPKSRKGGKLKIIKPQGAELVDANPKVRRLFIQASWYPLCTRLGDSHQGVAQEFAQTFNGKEATILGFQLQVSKQSIAEAFNLPQEVENWFKGKIITGGDLNSFIRDEYRDPNQAKGICRNYLKKEWEERVKLDKNFLTCERRYTIVFLYHMRFLFHFAGIRTLNLPYFILKSLTKMVARIQTHQEASKYNMYHQAIIKVLVEEELKKRNQTWDHFLFYRAGQPTPKLQETIKPSSIGIHTKRTSIVSVEGSSKRKTRREGVSIGAKSRKKKPLAAKSEKKKEQEEISSPQKVERSKRVPPIKPVPTVYKITRRRKLVVQGRSKVQVFPEIPEAREQQQEDQPLDSNEEILKEAGYTRTSKNNKEELKLVARARKRHTREKNKYRLK